jgi:hypothetical protein
MKQFLKLAACLIIIGFLFNSCKKEADSKVLYVAPVLVAKPFAPISDSNCLSGALNGTLVAGKTYHVCGNIIINAGDTLIIQPGVTIKFSGNYGIGVNGSLFSLGTQANPIWFTYDSSITKTDQIGANPVNDPAFKGLWAGIVGGKSCPYLVLKWTHIEFAGGTATGSLGAVYSGSKYPILFQNAAGIFVLEDSWIYGSVDDAIRTYGAKLAFLRNTFEKCGYTGGEALNAKGSTVGDYAYNVCIGIATNGPKFSNANPVIGFGEAEARIYNNTILNCGYRRSAAGRGGSINFEQGAAGMAYNNIMVNCKFGLRIVSNPIADTANIQYGNNLTYGDSAAVINNILPSQSVSSAITAPRASDIPNDFLLIPSGWKLGDTYTAASFIGANNPLFISGPVPLPAGTHIQDVVVVGNYHFGLQANSPAIKKGFTNFIPKGVVPVDPKYGVTELTPPGKDIGAYQYDGSGNQH